LLLSISPGCSRNEPDQSWRNPTVTLQPTDQSVTEGQQATFSVDYHTEFYIVSTHWLVNGSPIPDGTYGQRIYVTPPTTLANDGDRVQFQITNPYGTALSRVATLHVSPAPGPQISAQPLAQTTMEGSTARFEVKACGPAPLTYQWMMDGAPLPESNADHFELPAVSLADNGALFSVRVSNAAGQAESLSAGLTVLAGSRDPVGPARQQGTATAVRPQSKGAEPGGPSSPQPVPDPTNRP
jgi:hypothetical protein